MSKKLKEVNLFMFEIILKFLPVILPVVVFLIIFSIGYVKAPPDTAFIISGLFKPRTLIGRAGIRIPFLERLDRLSLKMFSVDVKTTDFVPNADYINVKVDASVKLRVGESEEMRRLAAQFFLNEREESIIARVQDTLEGNMREIIGQMKLKEMVTDRKVFAERVQANAIPDLKKMGLELIAFNVQSFVDQGDVIKDLGIDNISQIRKSAAIAKAEADRDVEIVKAQTAKEANDAKVQSDIDIAEKKNALSIKESELKMESDNKKAIADAVYKIQAQEQRRSLEITSVDADIAKTDKQAELKAKEVEVAKQTLDAEVRAKADASLYEQQKTAEAELYKRQKEAEAAKYEKEQEAEAIKIQAEANKEAKEQEAVGIAAVGKAEAEAIKAKALAEAEGINKKAEAMQKYGQAAVVEMIVGVLPEIAKNVAEPLTKVDKITMYGEGNNTKLIKDIINGTSQITQGISESMGLDLKSILAGALGGKLLSDVNKNISCENQPNQLPPAAPVEITATEPKDTPAPVEETSKEPVKVQKKHKNQNFTHGNE